MCVQLSALVEFVSRTSSTDVHLFVIESLTGSSLSVQFDSVTKTKTIATVIQKVRYCDWH